MAGNGIWPIAMDLLLNVRRTGSSCHFRHTLMIEFIHTIIDIKMANSHNNLQLSEMNNYITIQMIKWNELIHRSIQWRLPSAKYATPWMVLFEQNSDKTAMIWKWTELN